MALPTIQPYIDLGWYTVPLQGELKRLEDGSKSTPMFPKNWKAHYQEEFNQDATAIGGAITGALSNIIAIDCDSQTTFDLFQALDSDNLWHFISKGKPKGGGTIIYQYPHILDGSTPLPSFSIQDEHINLDFYSDNGFIYLPTPQNSTKEPWNIVKFEDLPPLHQPPAAVIALLHSLHKQYYLARSPKVQETLPKTKQVINYLAPQIELMIGKGEFIPSLFRIITPKDFRELDQYVNYGYLHPNKVPEGRGSEYLSKISAILGSDPSISKDLYTKAMYFINDLWDSPLKRSRLEDTIISPMLSSSARVNGEAIWQYDEYWSAKSFNFITKLGESCELFFDDERAIYYIINLTQSSVRHFSKDTDCFSYIEMAGQALPPRKDWKAMIPLVRTTNDPSLPFGFYSPNEYTRNFNIFRQTPELAILNNPAPYAAQYTQPRTIIAYFQSLVPDNQMRHYLLRFIKRKLSTFSYSPVVLYFLGAHGSGKDTLVNILASILGDDAIARPTTKEFLEQFNGWIVDTYFTQLDEYGNQLSRLQDKQEALGKIKAYSGKQTIQIRQMRTDGFAYNHNTTFILTANTNPLILEDGDRRIAFFETPNVLKDEEWVIKAGGMSHVHDQIQAEIKDFCFYLATEVEALSPDEYMSPPVTDQKHKAIASRLAAGPRIVYYLKYRLFDALEKLCMELDELSVFDSSTENKIFEDDLFALYMKMTEDAGSKRGLSASMAEFEKVPTTRNGLKAYYYKVPNLALYKRRYVFTTQDEEETVNVNL